MMERTKMFNAFFVNHKDSIHENFNTFVKLNFHFNPKDFVYLNMDFNYFQGLD